MSSTDRKKRNWKKKIFHELVEYWVNVAYLAMVFAAFTQYRRFILDAYDITDGMEGDKVDDPGSVFLGRRMRNGWKNSAPWTYSIDPEKFILKNAGLPNRFSYRDRSKGEN